MDSPLAADHVTSGNVLEEGAQIEGLLLNLSQRRVIAELTRRLAQNDNLTKDVLDSPGDDRGKVLVVAAGDGAKMLSSELDWCQRLLDLMSDLPGHLAPGFEPVRTEDFGDVLRDQHLLFAVG